MSNSVQQRGTLPPGMGFREFVAIAALLIGLNAFGIDTMLPALPNMGAALGIDTENHRQWIIASYLFGFGAAQIIYGPLADRFGRRPIVLTSLCLSIVTSLGAALAYDFETIVIARVLQGTAAAATRVLSVSIVRDCFSGRQMARVMSLTMIVFLAVPIIAPAFGQLILLVAPWEYIFLFLASYAALLLLWFAFRMPETQHHEDRRALSLRGIGQAALATVTNRYSLGYTVASTFLFSGLLAFINSVQQISTDMFQAGKTFTLLFAAAAFCMAVASYVNSRIVERLGTRLVSHVALLAYFLIALVHLAIALSGHETIWTFGIAQGLTMAAFGLAGSNFGAMAMEPMGHIAGTASSIQGTISTIGGTAIGIAIGQAYDGTTVPLTGGYVLFSFLAIITVLITERGRLFQPHAQQPAAAPQ